MLRVLALAFALLALPASAQDFPLPLNQYSIDQQVSANGVSSFPFVSGNSQRRSLYSLTVVSGAASGRVIVFDAAALPSDGAVAACTSSATTRPCVMWCRPLSANDAMSVQWMSPMRFTTGIIAAFSTGANCATLTASTTAMFQGQAP